MSKYARPEACNAVQAAIGQRMLWVREALDIGQAEAARLLGLHPSTLNKIERGLRAPSVFNVIEFGVRFRVGPEFLLVGALTELTDRELSLELVARHPQLRLAPANTDPDTQNTTPRASRFRPPKIPANGEH